VIAARPFLVALALTPLSATPAAAETVDHMYSPQTVDAIALTLPEDSIEALEEDPTGEYVMGTFSLAETDGTPTGVGAFSAPITVGIRLKGGTGSFEGLDGKAAFKVKFNEFVKKQTFLGLKKMTLNNMAQDPSMLHETLAYAAFDAAGIVAPRTGYASVSVNGEDHGLHLNVEAIDKDFLVRRFGPFDDPQHLYEGEYGADAIPTALDRFEVDEGDDDEMSDLEALVEAVGAEGSLLERIGPVADLEQMTRMWAIEKYVGHWDGYTALGTPNNFYLYSDPAGVFQMLPWGTDQTWDHPELSFGPGGGGGVLFRGCFADQDCRADYFAALGAADETVSGLGLEEQADQLAALLGPWQADESEVRRPYTAGQVAAGVAATKGFIAGRPAALAAWLATNSQPDPQAEAPDPQAEAPDPPAEAPDPPRKDPDRPAPDAPVRWRLELDRSRLSRGVLLGRVEVPGAGLVSLAARTFGERPALACAARASAAAGGVLTLRCRLSSAVRRRLATRRVKLRLRPSFDPGAGGRLESARTVLLARESL
jgi:hypothetical protein